MTLSRRALVVLALALSLAACAPRATEGGNVRPPRTQPQEQPQTQPQTPPGTPNLQNPDVRAVDRAAKEAFYLMGLAFERSGSYDVASLASDLDLPPGVKWQLEDISPKSYALRFTSDSVPDFAWLVTPQGVETTRADANRIL